MKGSEQTPADRPPAGLGLPAAPVQLPATDLVPVGPGVGPQDAAGVHEHLEVLARVPAGVHQLGEPALSALATDLEASTQRAEAALVAATAEALSRGLVAASQCADAVTWLTSRCPAMERPTARRIAAVAAATLERRNHALATALATGVVSVPAAHTALGEVDKVLPVLPEAPREEVLGWYLAVGQDPRDGSTAQLRRLTRWIVARFAPHKLHDQEERAQQCEQLTHHELPTGLVRFITDLSPAHAAQLIEALQPGSAPQPVTDPDTGQQRPDPRSAAKRRADALVELIGAATSIDETDSLTGSSKLIITTDLDTLRDWFPHPTDNDTSDTGDTGSDNEGTHSKGTDGTDGEGTDTDGTDTEGRNAGPAHRGGGRRRGGGCGITLTGRLLDAGTLRRLACQAQLIPAVLGTHSEPLDVGRSRRLVTAGLRTAVVLRDRHCTFPGCTRPPQWCEVHHVIPWLAGGPTSLANSALLCCRHHTIVHRDELTALVRPDRVTWDLTPGRMTRAGP